MTDPTPTPTDPPVDPANPPAPTDPPKPTDPADPPLGPAGIKALQEERKAREALEREFAPLRKLAASLAPGDPAAGKTELEKLAEQQAEMAKTIADERLARFRAEVANEKGLTAAQVARLNGSTREELLADADEFLALFPAGTAPKGGTPAPDPSQGARGTAIDIDSRIAEAQKSGDVTRVISLQNQKLRNAN